MFVCLNYMWEWDGEVFFFIATKGNIKCDVNYLWIEKTAHIFVERGSCWPGTCEIVNTRRRLGRAGNDGSR